MIKVNEHVYKAEEGKIIKSKSGQYIGVGIDLCESDSIDNYKEVKLTKANDVEGLLNKNE